MLLSRSFVSAPTALRLVLAGLAFVPAVPASAAEITAASRIGAVTVYPDAATVARIVDVDLPLGPSTLLFAGLPASLDPASLRVSGQAAGKLTILSVDSRPATAKAGR